MRFAALVVAALLAACGARGAGDPAWPKPAERETDGGESLAPRESIKAVAAAEAKAEKSDDVTEATAAAATPDAEAEATTPTTTSTPTITAPEDTIMIEEIVIEISDEE